jgi:hypothetical protein
VQPQQQQPQVQQPQPQPAAFPNSAFAPAQPAPTQPIYSPPPQQQPAPAAAAYTPAPPPPQQPQPQQPQFAPAPPARPAEYEHESSSIRQLELRAIFGVDREMSPDEILQRTRSLPGIRHIARVSLQDVTTVDAMKQVISNLGFGGGGLKLYAGAVPIEFIREGSVLLAVQTDGGFAPGVRETLMIVGRELSRM